MLLIALVAAAPRAAGAAPARIVSINLCTDELLLKLADPGQIAALSPYAVDPDMTLFADKARLFRHDAATAEAVVAIHPDLVLSGRYSSRAMREILALLSHDVAEFDLARTIAESEALIRGVADRIGHADRGEALVATIEAARSKAEASIPAGRRPTAVVYQRRGYVSGGQTLTGELLALAGIDDIGGRIAGPEGGFTPLEKIVQLRPDFLVVTEPAGRPVDQGSALLAHPALAALYPPERRIVLPETLTVCGAASLPEAIAWVSDEAARIRGALRD
jgi:iron complex transport system substrate-binding protein